jgi:quinol monooxygenase YgiN
MSVLVIADMQIKPGRADEALGVLATMLGDTRAFDGCRDLKVYRGQGGEDRVLLVEEWDSSEQHLAYRAWRATAAVSPLAELYAAPPVVSYFEPQPNV